MFSIQKIGSLAIATAISASLLLSATSLATAAETTAPIAVAKASQTNAAKAAISKSEAKQIVEDHLKDVGRPNLRVTSVRTRGDYWIVSVKTTTGLHAATMKVDKNSGELS